MLSTEVQRFKEGLLLFRATTQPRMVRCTVTIMGRDSLQTL